MKERKSLYQILDKQGFYIILLLCVSLIAGTAFWINNRKDGDFIAEEPTSPFEDSREPEVTLVEDTRLDGQEDVQETGKIGQGRPEEKEDTKKEEDSRKQKDGIKEEANGQNKNSSRPSKESNIKSEPDKKQGPKSDINIKNKDRVKDSREEEKRKEEKERQEGHGQARDSQARGEEDRDLEREGPDKEVGGLVEAMAQPTLGEVILPFAEDRLVYHKTLDHWSTHKGIDIGAKEGSPVKAVLDGEVVEVTRDPIMGISIILKHDNGVLTVYSNLSTDAMVELGERVNKGQTISNVGRTAAAKALEGPLLHFQVFQGDKFVDPQLYLAEAYK